VVDTDEISRRSRRLRSISGHSRRSSHVHREQVEGVEVGPLPAEQQSLEIAPPPSVEADDFAIEHAVVCLHRVRQLLAEPRAVLERVPISGAQLAVMTVDVGERAETVVFHLEQPVGGSRKGSGMPTRGMGWN